MYVFNRTRITNPTDLPEAKALAVKIASVASKIVGRPITAFETRFGGPGHISWSTPVEDMATLGDLTEKLSADPAFQKLMDKGRSLWGHAEDQLMQIIASSITSSENQLYASTVATPAPGKLAEVVAYGVKVQEYVTKAGFHGVFGASTFGRYGEVGWLAAFDSMTEVDAFQKFLHSDTGMAKLIDSSGPLFVAGSGFNRLVSRL
jgi:hypothetical protein